MSDDDRTVSRIETALAADREALAFHLRQAQEGLAVQRDRSLPVIAGGAAVLAGLVLIRALVAGRGRRASRPGVGARSGRAMARATRLMGVATAAWRVWPQVQALARRVQLERTRGR